jgi:hypothetical protein
VPVDIYCEVCTLHRGSLRDGSCRAAMWCCGASPGATTNLFFLLMFDCQCFRAPVVLTSTRPVSNPDPFPVVNYVNSCTASAFITVTNLPARQGYLCAQKPVLKLQERQSLTFVCEGTDTDEIQHGQSKYAISPDIITHKRLPTFEDHEIERQQIN